jgi:prepilin-type N-terminal cleavage/methylation domain-containing protein
MRNHDSHDDIKSPTTLTVSATQSDNGYTLIELVLVTLILGIVTSVVIFTVTGVHADAAGAGCDADDHTLGNATEAYFALHGATTIPATGIDNDRFEQTLVEQGLLREASEYYDLDATGATISEGDSSC